MTLNHRLKARTPHLAAWAFVVCLVASACQPEGITPGDIEGPFTWGGVDNVTHVRHLWFAAQPDEAALEEAKSEGVDVVINLRDPSEHEWDEKAVVEGLGMAYYNLPVRGGEPFDRETFERIETLVAKHRDKQVLIHCSSSNRVGGWLATHLARRHGLSVEESLAVGRRAGITKEGIEQAVRGYLAKSP